MSLLLLALVSPFGCGSKGETAPGGGADSGGGDTAACSPSSEVCNGVDDDCDGSVDEEPTDGVAIYTDEDGDGYGAVEAGTVCEAAADQVTEGGDCDDADGEVNPGVAEVCNNGKDDDCDGGANGCTLAGELEVDWAPTRILTVEGDRLLDELMFGDINADGELDLFLLGNITLSGGPSPGAWLIPGPFDGDVYTSAATGALDVPDMTILGVKALDDFNGDGVTDFAVSATGPIDSWSGDNESFLYFYFGAEEEIPEDGEGLIEGAASEDDFSGKLFDESPVLVSECWGPRSRQHYWCAFASPWTSPAYDQHDAYLHGMDTANQAFGAADLNGDGLDEVIFGEQEALVAVVEAPFASLEEADANATTRCAAPGDSWGSGAGVLDVDADGYQDLLIGDARTRLIHAWFGPVLQATCDLSLSPSKWEYSDGTLNFTPHPVGDLDDNATDDWVILGWTEEGESAAFLISQPTTGVSDVADASVIIRGNSSDEGVGGWVAPAGEGKFALGLGNADDPGDLAIAIFEWREGR